MEFIYDTQHHLICVWSRERLCCAKAAMTCFARFLFVCLWYPMSHPYGTLCLTLMVPYVSPLWYPMSHPYGTLCLTLMVPYVSPLWYPMSHPYGTLCLTLMVPYVSPLWYPMSHPYGTLCLTLILDHAQRDIARFIHFRLQLRHTLK